MDTMDYEKQAIAFLEKTGTIFTCVFLKKGKHFDDDKEDRDIYSITLKRGDRSYTFKFGNSIANTFSAMYGKTSVLLKSEWRKLPKQKIITFIRWYSKFNDFGAKKTDIINMPKPPTAYDVLCCLQKYDPSTLEDFCSEYGYDTNSKKAEKTYLAVKEEYLNVCALFNSVELEELTEIQ